MTLIKDVDGRVGRLRKLFRDVLGGKRKITTSGDAKLFIEAIQTHETPSVCVEKLAASANGLEAVRYSVRADLSPSFIQSYTLGLLLLLSTDEVKALAQGQMLGNILEVIVNPPTVWNALVKSFLGHQIEERYLTPFAWLLHELLTTPYGLEFDIIHDAQEVVQNGGLSKSSVHATRDLAYKIEKVLQLKTASLPTNMSFSPGGRHDNDFADFRQIATYPTTDEFLATERPFYRRANEVFEVPPAERAAVHLDNQYRLLREDMNGELREDLQVSLGRKRGKRSALILHSIAPVGMDLGDEKRGKKSSLVVICQKGLEELRKLPEARRRKFLADNKNYLKHQAFGALFQHGKIFGFAFVNRNDNLLCMDPPAVCLQFTDSRTLGKALLALKSPDTLNFMLVDTPVFAYEPVLNELKTMNDLPLQGVLLNVEESSETYENSNKLELPSGLRTLVSRLGSAPMTAGGARLDRTNARMDSSQLESLLGALEHRLSVIQGPPGTGKSFTGAHIVECLYSNSKQRVMVIAYTNHALDQFLEELMDAGIREDTMVRLGSKYTDRTASLLIPRHFNGKLASGAMAQIAKIKEEQAELRGELHSAFEEYVKFTPTFQSIREHLEFSHDDRHFYEAFALPAEEQKWKRVGKKGKEVKEDYLFERWRQGGDPGIFTKHVRKELEMVWDMEPALRKEYLTKWVEALIQEKVEGVEELTKTFDLNQQCIDDLYNTGKGELLRSKRIIGCTTTAAAMQQKLIRAASPDVILVEEAGEILESHVLTAMSPSVKQLILIGDHKQLRPKVNNYALTVEKGDGYDLNMSLFERLIRQGFRHTTLRKQHRMDPEISRFPRALTYPDLEDGHRTAGRPMIDGLLDRVIFVNHEHPETELPSIADKRDVGFKASKQNEFESMMLRLLRQKLEQENDPILNDLDASALIQAGLMTQAASKVGKRPLHNYQGEESDIVIASLTRGNKRGEIGFMGAAERLNVLITRARNCLIMIGNMDTFMSSKGKSTWIKFFEMLKERNHLYDGIPVRCERHPEKTGLLKTPLDFDNICPDGGCAEPCGAMFKCGLHICKRRCHRVADHSQTECTSIVDKVCDKQHKYRVVCHKKDEACRKCIEEQRELERRARRDLELEKERLKRQEEYQSQLKQLKDEAEHQRRIMKYMTEADEQKKTLAQQQRDLQALKETTSRLSQIKKAQASASQNPPQTTPKKPKTKGVTDAFSGAQAEWEHYKKHEEASNDALDELMDMIGLEEVKQSFLEIKAKVDTKLRQAVPLASERFSCSLLGNPGTGKTTVARIYAKFLTSVGVIPGSRFVETTGAKLANQGVNGCEKLIDGVLNDGGGVIFIDEAYQLTSGNSYGGGAVLDYLLPEVENLTGKIVFVLAGYNKQMESFFAHNPGLPSRFPIEMKFADYKDEELLQILGLKITKQYEERMKCEDGLEGLFCRIVSRRVGRGRGREGFGNARTIENTLAKITQRQATRLTRERRAGRKPDDFLLTKEDLIGPEPSEALAKSEGWIKLQKLIGLKSVKQAVKALVSSVEQNYQRELDEQAPIEYSLNKVFLGNPGTGKTTVAKLYGQILVDLGLLSKGEVVIKNPSDFVGSVLGQSEQQTKGILAASEGKVLVIDEAYGLYGGGGHQGSSSDPYKTSVIDTIVAEVQSVPGDDRCVLLLGYKDQMETMFQNVNPGLSRRFPISSAFEFEDFDGDELRDILNLKLDQQGFKATGQAKDVAMEMLDRARNRPNFGNAGEIDIILNDAKAKHQSRFSRGEARLADTLEAIDLDENFDRAQGSETDIRKLFEGTVGSEDIVNLLLGYQDTVRKMKSLDMDPKENIPFNFLFRGPPGTGKTTTAKKMGKVFYDMGFLATAEVVECSATDLIGQYVGQTGPKVQQLLEKALGKVLFIDEAYRLADGHFANDAVNELVDSVTKDKFHKKLIIILAGYESDINHLMSVNEGLTSRFPEVVNFRSLRAQECMTLLKDLLSRQRAQLHRKGVSFDLTVLESPTSFFTNQVTHLFSALIKQASWASARDVKTVSQSIFKQALKCQVGPKQLLVDEQTVILKLQDLYNERESRSRTKRDGLSNNRSLDIDTAPAATQNAPKTSINIAKTPTSIGDDPSDGPEAPAPETQTVKQESEAKQPSRDQGLRDAGVSDAVWEQLQRDRQAEQEREDEYQRLLEAKNNATEAEREKIVKRLLEEERRREQEAEMQKKLAQMGVCPMGYQWIKQASGYRCAGGSHFMADEQLKSSCS
ncbi:hypothetical protein DL764_008430 [Monosporascus ibericus]|uniref:AAA+ ATPase domain-containing protein n=1 Tax=Monosporascus ibericus TaxID=155417 RepID=A0A4Q4T0B5_9PEZI|nr:hypothetical protein DL764_008430 [Monosporascus ibericus]